MNKGPRAVAAMLPSAAVIFSLTVRSAGCSPGITPQMLENSRAILAGYVPGSAHGGSFQNLTILKAEEWRCSCISECRTPAIHEMQDPTQTEHRPPCGCSHSSTSTHAN